MKRPGIRAALAVLLLAALVVGVNLTFVALMGWPWSPDTQSTNNETSTEARDQLQDSATPSQMTADDGR